MKANLWALILSLCLAGTAEAQRSVFSTPTNSLGTNTKDGKTLFDFARAFAHATNTVATNSAKEFADLRAKAEKGDADAQGILGSTYNFGQGVDKDQAEAVKWFRKAAEQGEEDAQYNLGVCYGKGVRP
jgi:TPR repeat protein